MDSRERNGSLDLTAIPALKEMSHLPVIVDPSHATGKWNLVAPMSRAAIAAGADGLLIEVHSDPECALCDGEESIKPSRFKDLMTSLKKVAEEKERQRIIREKKKIVEHYDAVKARILQEIEEKRIKNRDLIDKAIDAVEAGYQKVKQKFIYWTYTETYDQTIGKVAKGSRAMVDRVKRFNKTLRKICGREGIF